MVCVSVRVCVCLCARCACVCVCVCVCACVCVCVCVCVCACVCVCVCACVCVCVCVWFPLRGGSSGAPPVGGWALLFLPFFGSRVSPGFYLSGAPFQFFQGVGEVVSLPLWGSSPLFDVADGTRTGR